MCLHNVLWRRVDPYVWITELEDYRMKLDEFPWNEITFSPRVKVRTSLMDSTFYPFITNKAMLKRFNLIEDRYLFLSKRISTFFPIDSWSYPTSLQSFDSKWSSICNNYFFIYLFLICDIFVITRHMTGCSIVSNS